MFLWVTFRFPPHPLPFNLEVGILIGMGRKVPIPILLAGLISIEIIIELY